MGARRASLGLSFLLFGLGAGAYAAASLLPNVVARYLPGNHQFQIILGWIADWSSMAAWLAGLLLAVRASMQWQPKRPVGTFALAAGLVWSSFPHMLAYLGVPLGTDILRLYGWILRDAAIVIGALLFGLPHRALGAAKDPGSASARVACGLAALAPALYWFGSLVALRGGVSMDLGSALLVAFAACVGLAVTLVLAFVGHVLSLRHQNTRGLAATVGAYAILGGLCVDAAVFADDFAGIWLLGGVWFAGLAIVAYRQRAQLEAGDA